MDEKDKSELCALLYDTLLETAAFIHDGEAPRGYFCILVSLHQAMSDFHYARPNADIFAEDMELFAHGAKTMNYRHRDQAWFDSFRERFRSGCMSDCLPICYHSMFVAIMGAIAALERQDLETAKHQLSRGRRAAEAQYMFCPGP